MDIILLGVYGIYLLPYFIRCFLDRLENIVINKCNYRIKIVLKIVKTSKIALYCIFSTFGISQYLKMLKTAYLLYLIYL